MSQLNRPQIDPLVLAELIDAAPGRVRKRLDKEPSTAESWDWKTYEDGWSVSTGEETVRIVVKQGKVDSIAAIQCTCLLSPRCFHILACINILQPIDAVQDHQSVEIDGESDNSARVDLKPPQPVDVFASITQLVAVDAEMRKVVERVLDELRILANVGGRRADLLRQSGLLRAAHGCRAVGLINLGNVVMRVAESIRRQRENSDTADAHVLAEGMALALEQCQLLLQSQQVPQGIVGQARRQFSPCDIGKLLGICAEPVLTLSGYAGVVVYLQSLDSNSKSRANTLFTVSHARPGDSHLAKQAYRGGIDMGSLTLQAFDICRGQLLVQNLTVSADGRLGKGASTRWVMIDRPIDSRPLFQGRFGSPLTEQVNGVFSQATVSQDQRVAGWDLVAFDAQVLGAQQSALLVRVRDSAETWKLRIAIDNPALPFRENLSLLARCPGLPLRCLGRLRLQAAGEVDLLAITESDADWIGNISQEESLPQLKFDAKWKGICNLGFDRLERWNVEGIKRWSEDISLEEASETLRGEFAGAPLDGLDALRRRQVGIALGGRHAVAELGSDAHQRDRNQLRQRHLHTAGDLIDLLAAAAHQREPGSRALGTDKGETLLPLDRLFLANHLYLQHASTHFQRLMWLRKVTT